MQAFLSLFTASSDEALPFKAKEVAEEEEEEAEEEADTVSTPQELLRSSSKKVLVVPARRISYTPPWRSMSFSCGGWLQFYLFGVARALQAAGLDKGVTYCGCSAGALAAAGLALDGDFDSAIEYCKDECIPMAHGHVFGLFMLADYVSKCVDMLVVPKFDHDMLAQGNLQIAISRLPFGPYLPILASERVTQHPSPEDLKQTLLSSCAAWPAAPLTNHPRFGLCVDGGLSDFQPIVDAETITVSPFYFSDCDIKPSRYVPPWWAMVPPKSRDTIDWTYNLGWDDAMAFIAKKGIPTSPHVRPHLSDKKIRQENNHPFDTPRKISMHRFLGYDLFDITHQYVSFTMDLLLLLFLLLVWRPVALVAIYFELFFRLLFSIAMSFFYELLEIGWPVVSVLAYTFYKLPHRVQGGGLLFVAWTGKMCSKGPHTLLKRNCLEMRGCLACLLSLSLLLRFFSSFNRPSSAELRKHDKLYKHSVLYRVLRHII